MTARLGDILGALLWLAIFAGVPAAVAWHGSRGTAGDEAVPAGQAANRAPLRPPPVEPMEILAVDQDQARVINAKVPFSPLPNPAARPFRFAGSEAARARAVDCLAAAQYYEAGDDAPGQRAVAQVVLNRLRHPAFPKTVCDVVFQGAERRTGCQFTFTCDGALARTPSDAAWDRARQIARDALAGAVYKPIGYATHYHTDWVVPYWSASLDKVSAVGTHLFFRWTGWWGTPGAFHRTVSSEEPAISRIARLSTAHRAPVEAPLSPALSAAAAMAAAPVRTIGADALGKRFDNARLIAIEPGSNAFILTLDRASAPDSWRTLAATFCAGRQKCRILAWTDAARAPDGFPIDHALLPAMAFSYIHDAATGLQRALWNCDRTPRANPADCMRRQVGPAVPLPPGVRRKRYEDVRISAPLQGAATQPANSAD